MNKKRSISLLLLLCFSVVLVHSIVPHHHHVDVLIAADGDTCPAGHCDHHKTEGHDNHCHAFNELSFVKSSIPELNEPSVSVYFLAECSSDKLLNFKNTSGITLLPTDLIPPQVIFAGDSFSLRGPPSTC